MIFLSKLLRLKNVTDFTFDPRDEEDYPLVRHVIVKKKAHGLKSVEPLEFGPEEDDGKLARLRRDVLDGQVLDLENRRATRANDLILKQDQEGLRLHAVDTGPGAVLRRFTGGRVCPVNPGHFYDWKYVEFLRGNPEAVTAGHPYRGRVTRLPAGDIAALAEAVPYLHAAELLMLLDVPLATAVFQIVGDLRQQQIFPELPSERAHQILDRMSPDLAVGFLARLGLEKTRELLPRIGPEQRERLLKLLRFPSNVAAGRITNDVLALPATSTVHEAREQFRKRQPRFVQMVYLLGRDEKLSGMLPITQLLLAQDENQTLDELGTPYINVIPSREKARAAAHKVLRSHLPALPVVSERGDFLGAFTLDAALDCVLPRNLSSQVPRVFP